MGISSKRTRSDDLVRSAEVCNLRADLSLSVLMGSGWSVVFRKSCSQELLLIYKGLKSLSKVILRRPSRPNLGPVREGCFGEVDYAKAGVSHRDGNAPRHRLGGFDDQNGAIPKGKCFNLWAYWFDDRVFSNNRFHRCFRKIWGLEAWVAHRNNNLMLINFKTEADMLKVLRNGPYWMEGGLLGLESYQSESRRFTKLSIWIRLRNIPPGLMNTITCKKLAHLFGNVDCVYMGYDHTRNARYVRARVCIDPTKPLIPGLLLQDCNGCEFWLPCQYEKVLKICNRCGVIGHPGSRCNLTEEGKVDSFVNESIFQQLRNRGLKTFAVENDGMYELQSSQGDHSKKFKKARWSLDQVQQKSIGVSGVHTEGVLWKDSEKQESLMLNQGLNGDIASKYGDKCDFHFVENLQVHISKGDLASHERGKLNGMYQQEMKPKTMQVLEVKQTYCLKRKGPKERITESSPQKKRKYELHSDRDFHQSLDANAVYSQTAHVVRQVKRKRCQVEFLPRKKWRLGLGIIIKKRKEMTWPDLRSVKRCKSQHPKLNQCLSSMVILSQEHTGSDLLGILGTRKRKALTAEVQCMEIRSLVKKPKVVHGAWDLSPIDGFSMVVPKQPSKEL